MSGVRPVEDRIAALFLRGFSLDLISELGCAQGWTRHAAKAVVAARGWALDWSGRLQPEFLGPDHSAKYETIVEATTEKMISVATDSERAAVRAAANRCQAGIDELRAVLLLEEEHDALVAHRREKMRALSGLAGQDRKGSAPTGTGKGLTGAQGAVQRSGEAS